MGQRNDHRQAKGQEKEASVFGIFPQMDPFEEPDHKADQGQDSRGRQVELHCLEMAVERVVEGGVCAASDQQTDASEVKPQQQSEGL